MLKIYEIIPELQRVRDQLEHGEEIDLEWLEQLECALEDKTEGILAILKEAEAEKEAVREAKKKLDEKEKVLGNKIDNLTSFALNLVKLMNGGKFKSPLHSATVVQSPPAVEILDLEQIDPRFIEVRVKETLHVSKADVVAEKEKTGEDPPGTKVTRGFHLRRR